MQNARSDTLTRRQLAALTFCALLSPLIRQIPATVVGRSGRGAWISAAAALAPTALVLWLMGLFLRRRQPGEGLGEMVLRALGEGFGRAVVFVYAVWLLFYGGFVLRAGADRFAAAVFPKSPVWLFMGVMTVILIPAVLGRLKTLSRCAEVLTPLLLALFLLVFAFAVPQMDADELLPLRYSDIPGIAAGVVPAAETLLIAVYFFFLAGRVEEGGMFRRMIAPAAVLAVLGAGLCITTVGTFGAALTDKMNYPFFVMIRGIRVFNLLERIEALVIAQWVAADFLLLGALGQMTSSLLTLALCGRGKERSRTLSVLSLAAMTAAGVFCAPTAFALRSLARSFIPHVNAAMFASLLVIFIIGKIRKKI